MRSLGCLFLTATLVGCSTQPPPVSTEGKSLTATVAAPVTAESASILATDVAASPSASANATVTHRPDSKQTLMADSGHIVEVYPPLDRSTQAQPLVVFLHATCMQPADVCDFWSKGGRDSNWLVCPAGPSICYGAPDWSGTPTLKADTLKSALSAVDNAYAQWVDHDKGDVLIGYSRGAFAARDILYERPGLFHGLILLSAAIKLDPEKLKAAGIRRAVFATGDLDGSRAVMRHTMQTLEAAGIPSEFVSLGKIGHWLPNDLESIMHEAIAWVETPVS